MKPGDVTIMLRLLSLLLLIFPSIVFAFFREIFPKRRKSLKGKVALVSGAGRGLGRGLALRLAKEGCKVAAVDLDKDTAEQTTKEIRLQGGTAQAYATNVANVQEVKALRTAILKDLGDVYLLVNNAGIVHAELFDDMEDDTIRTMIDVNLTSQYWMVREFLPDMKKCNSGHIVAVASVTAFLAGVGGSVYCATKAGVKGLMDVLRAELRLNGSEVNITTVFPFFINTRHIDKFEIKLYQFPVLTVEEVVEATVDAIKSDKVYLSIPRKDYVLIHCLMLLPQFIIDKAVDILSTTVRMRPSPKKAR